MLAERLLPASRHNVPYLDAIRGIAVLSILFRHAWGMTGGPPVQVLGIDWAKIFTMLSSGVDLFFVLSGVLLAARYLRADASGTPPPRYSEYFTARILRIGPPYWLALGVAVFVLIPLLSMPTHAWDARGFATFGTHAVFAQMLVPFAQGAYGIVGQFWTLSIEMCFYLILPVMVRAFYNGRWWQGVVASFAVSIAWLWLCRNSLGGLVSFIHDHSFGVDVSPEQIRFLLSRQIVAYLPHFAIGISISAVLISGRKNFLTGHRAGVVYAILGTCVLAWAMYRLGGIARAHPMPHADLFKTSNFSARFFYYAETLPFAVGYGLLILGVALSPARLKDGVARIPGLCFFGVIGYSVYLLHWPMLVLMSHIPWVADDHRMWPATAKLFLPGGALITVVSLAYFLLVERPSMAMATRFSRLGRSRSAHAMHSRQETPLHSPEPLVAQASSVTPGSNRPGSRQLGTASTASAE